MAYLCFDVGSSAVKAAVVSEGGLALGASRADVTTRHGPGGEHEIDSRQWLEGAMAAGGAALAAARARPGGGLELRAISVSGNGPTLLAADDRGEPLGPALSWLDRRAQAEAEEVSRAAGVPIDATFYLPKALFIWRAMRAEGRDRIRWFFSCPEYLVYALCGTALTYLPDPGYGPYIWTPELLAALGLPPERFPPFARPTETAGGLSARAAERLGLAEGTPVVAGFPDFLASVVGTASVRVGWANDRTGSSEALNLCAEAPFPTRELLSLPHAIAPLWNLSGGLSTSGAALDWLASLLRLEGGAGGLAAEAARSRPGAKGLVFLPYLAGERAPLWDTRLSGQFVGLRMEHGREDLARAACESMAYGLRLASDCAVGAGLPFELARVSGGAASDELLCRIKAEVLGVPVEEPETTDGELLGDAAACAVALGDAASLEEAALRLYRARRRFEPSAPGGREREAYEEGFAAYKAALASARRV